MHFSFIPYGHKDFVDLMLRDMQSEKHVLLLNKKDENTRGIWIQGQVRLLPFGLYEYVFPKEDLDKVLTTLNAKQGTGDYGIKWKMIPMKLIRKFLKLKKVPEYSEENRYQWIIKNVAIFPIGIREDGEMTDPDGPSEGWTHEAI